MGRLPPREVIAYREGEIVLVERLDYSDRTARRPVRANLFPALVLAVDYRRQQLLLDTEYGPFTFFADRRTVAGGYRIMEGW
jgi:hypothetical protein